MIWVIVGLLLLGIAAWGPIASNVEQAKYEVIETHGNIEVRRYAPAIVAETLVKGEREAAINEGFRAVADYIFGNNTALAKVAMTAPVTQQAEKITMTAPVTQQEGKAGEWKVRFVMPAEYTLKTLPKPNNTAVKLATVPEKHVVAIRFSGVARKDSIAAHTQELEAFVAEKKLRPRGVPTLAFYNPPWTLPFLRRNEVMVEIRK